MIWEFSVKKRKTKRKVNPATMGDRLRQLRQAYHWQQFEICAWTGIRATNWQRYEKHGQRISLNHAFELRRVTGASLEFIYFGNVQHLEMELLKRLTKELTV